MFVIVLPTWKNFFILILIITKILHTLNEIRRMGEIIYDTRRIQILLPA